MCLPDTPHMQEQRRVQTGPDILIRHPNRPTQHRSQDSRTHSLTRGKPETQIGHSGQPRE